MVGYPDEIRFAYRSERLVYRALEDNEADKNFVFELNNDPIITAMSDMAVLRPVAAGNFSKFADWAKTCQILSVACLPPPVAAAADDEDGKDNKPDVMETTTTRISPREVTTAQVKDLTPIGFVAVMGGGAPERTSRHRNGMIGLSILQPFTAKGYGGEMINWALDWAFKSANLHRVAIGCWGNNANALKLYKSLGFVHEGVDREALAFERKFIDIVKFGMLEQEWEKLRGIAS